MRIQIAQWVAFLCLTASLFAQMAPAPPDMPNAGGSPDGYEPVGDVGLDSGISDSGDPVDREETPEGSDPGNVNSPGYVDPDEAERELDNEGNIRLPTVREDMEAQQADIDEVVGILKDIAAEESAAINNVFEEVVATETAGDGAILGQRRLPAALMVFAPERLFRSLPGIANPVREIFILLSFPILMWALAQKIKESRDTHDNLKSVAGMMIVSALVLMTPWMLSTLDKLTRYVSFEINQRVNGVVTDDTISRMYNLSVIFGNMDTAVLMNAFENSDNYEYARRMASKNEESTPGEVTSEALRNSEEEEDNVLKRFWGYTKEIFTTMPDPFHGIMQWLIRLWDFIMAFAKVMLISILGFILQIFLTLCAYLILFMENMRMLIIYISAIILPLFIAGTMLDSFRSQSFNFIFSVIGIFAWPIGWALGNVGTSAILMAFADFLSEIGPWHLGGGAAIAINPGAPNEESALLSTLVGTLNGESPLPGLHPTVIAEVIFLPIAYWGVLLGLVVLLFGWVLTTAIAAPLLIQRVVISGSNFAQSLVGGAVQAGPSITTAAAGTAAAGLAASAGTSGSAGGSGAAGGGGASGPGGGTEGSGGGGKSQKSSIPQSAPTSTGISSSEGESSGESPSASAGPKPTRMAQIAKGASMIGRNVIQPGLTMMQSLGAFLDDAKPMAPTIRPMEYKGRQGQADMQVDWHNDGNQQEGGSKKR